MSGDSGLPIELMLVLLALPVAVAAFFGLFAFKGITPLAYRCLRCAAEFQRPPYRRFPVACPRCGSRDWNAI